MSVIKAVSSLPKKALEDPKSLVVVDF